MRWNELKNTTLLKLQKSYPSLFFHSTCWVFFPYKKLSGTTKIIFQQNQRENPNRQKELSIGLDFSFVVLFFFSFAFCLFFSSFFPTFSLFFCNDRSLLSENKINNKLKKRKKWQFKAFQRFSVCFFPTIFSSFFFIFSFAFSFFFTKNKEGFVDGDKTRYKRICINSKSFYTPYPKLLKVIIINYRL